MSVAAKIRALREAGRVERCHTVPHVGSYSVGQHCYDALSLLLLLHPNPSATLIKAVLWHDTAERWLGDVPAPAKWSNPRLRAAIEAAEVPILDGLGLAFIKYLGPEDRKWLTAVDFLELWLWEQDQIAFGNRNAQVIADNLKKSPPDLPSEVREAMVGLAELPVERTDELADYQEAV